MIMSSSSEFHMIVSSSRLADLAETDLAKSELINLTD